MRRREGEQNTSEEVRWRRGGEVINEVGRQAQALVVTWERKQRRQTIKAVKRVSIQA